MTPRSVAPPTAYNVTHTPVYEDLSSELLNCGSNSLNQTFNLWFLYFLNLAHVPVRFKTSRKRLINYCKLGELTATLEEVKGS